MMMQFGGMKYEFGMVGGKARRGLFLFCFSAIRPGRPTDRQDEMRVSFACYSSLIINFNFWQNQFHDHLGRVSE